jgi:hypothetical protein
MKRESEISQQQSYWMWFNNEFCTKNKSPRLIIHSVVNGFGFNIPTSVPKQFHAIIFKSIATAVKLLEISGMTKGVSDMMIHGVNGRCLWVECKTSTGNQRKEQIEMQLRVEKLGGRYIIVRSLIDFKFQININLPWLLGEE